MPLSLHDTRRFPIRLPCGQFGGAGRLRTCRHQSPPACGLRETRFSNEPSLRHFGLVQPGQSLRLGNEIYGLISTDCVSVASEDAGYPPRRAVPVAPVPFEDGNTTRLLSFARLALIDGLSGPSPFQAMSRQTAGRPRPLSLEPPGYPLPSDLDRLREAGRRCSAIRRRPCLVGEGPRFSASGLRTSLLKTEARCTAGWACMAGPVARRWFMGNPPLVFSRSLS